tara:strand:+ start:688 stop:3060 length:2373 start_codon:yes stop_codon:yes gene_type:complete
MSGLTLTLHDHVNFELTGLSRKEVEKIRDRTGILVKGCFTTAAYKAKIWDGRESLFDESGLGLIYELDKILDIVEDFGFDLDRDIDLVNKCEPFSHNIEPVKEDFLLEESGYLLRDYQLDAINAAITERMGLFDIGTNGGKSWICVGISKAYDQLIKSVVIVPTEKLARQTYADYSKTQLDVAVITAKTKPVDRKKLIKSKRHIILTSKLFLNLFEEFKNDRWAIMVDECFHPSHEILTRDGWKPVADIVVGEEVMAYDHKENRLRFEATYNTVAKPFSGDLMHLQSGKSIDILTTPNHNQPVFTTTGKPVVIQVKDVVRGRTLPISSHIDGSCVGLTATEKLMIAFEADGHHLYTSQDGVHTYRFAFRRERKIDRLEDILRQCGISYKKTVNARGDTNITFKHHEIFEKSLLWFDPYVSSERNADFLFEVGQWDGHVKSNGTVQWDIARKDDADLFCLTASLCGWHAKCNTPYKTGHRLAGIYRCEARKRERIKLTDSTPTPVPYDGFVYCVSVPSGNVLTRRNGVISISGNCHTFGDVFSEIMRFEMGHCPVRIGMSGSIPKKKVDPYKRNKIMAYIGGGILRTVKQKELMSRGISSKMKIELAITKHREVEEIFKELGREFEWSIEENYNLSNVERIQAIADFITSRHESEPKNTLILCHAGTGKILSEILNVGLIVDDTKSDVRDELFSKFDTCDDHFFCATFGTSGTGISSNRIRRMYLIDVGKNYTYIMQGIGRGLRLDGETNELEAIDISSDNVYGKKHRKDRLAIYREEEYEYTDDKTIIYV